MLRVRVRVRVRVKVHVSIAVRVKVKGESGQVREGGATCMKEVTPVFHGHHRGDM